MPTLHLTGSRPDWITSQAYRTIQSTLNRALSTVEATLRPSTERDVLKRKHLPACSISLKPGSPVNPHTLILITTGDDPRNDLVQIMLSMPKEAILTFREFFKAYPSGIYTTTAPVVTQAASLPQFDDETHALYLDALRDLGGTVTLETARATALKAPNSKHLLDACITAGFLLNKNGICSISPAGQALLARLMDPPEEAPAPVKAAPSEFETLRGAVQSAREHHAFIEAKHRKSQPLRLELERQLNTARSSLNTAEQNVATLEDRLTKARQQHNTSRVEVLRLEEQERQLPDIAAAYDHAKRTLLDAEKAYQAYVQL